MKPKAIAWLILGTFILVVLLQNTQVVSIRFLFWKLSMSGIVLLPMILFTGFFAGLFTGKYMKIGSPGTKDREGQT